MRKVNLRYRCSVCGSEVRMTSATADLPEAPRHCMDEMDLVTPVDDL
jgi:DNA-directed RNA polymerase subunit RPC12/RpoP